MNLCKTKGVLGSWKLWFSYIKELKIKKIISSIPGKRSRAELKILQLEPARLGLITIIYAFTEAFKQFKSCHKTQSSRCSGGCKGDLITMVVSSKKHAKSLSSTFQPKMKKLRIVIWHIFLRKWKKFLRVPKL